MDNSDVLGTIKQELAAIINESDAKNTDAMIENISKYCLRKVSSNILNNSPIAVEAAEGIFLELPPSPRASFQDRPRREDGKRMSLAEFLEREWGDYQHYDLLYSEHLRLIDPSLYRACLNRAYNSGTAFTTCLLQHGILAKEHLKCPPVGREFQTKILRAVQSRVRIHPLENSDCESVEEARLRIK